MFWAYTLLVIFIYTTISPKLSLQQLTPIILFYERTLDKITYRYYTNYIHTNYLSSLNFSVHKLSKRGVFNGSIYTEYWLPNE